MTVRLAAGQGVLVPDPAPRASPSPARAHHPQAAQLQAGDKELVAALVRMLGDTITGAVCCRAGQTAAGWPAGRLACGATNSSSASPPCWTARRRQRQSAAQHVPACANRRRQGSLLRRAALCRHLHGRGGHGAAPRL